MSMIPIQRPAFFRISSHGTRKHHRVQTLSASWTMAMDSKSSRTKKADELAVERKKISIPELKTVNPSNLQFDRLQPSNQEIFQEDRTEFGQFVARKALLDEEYWTAAWLRAESHWEDQINERYVESLKRKFAEQEFNALKQRCKRQHIHKSTCIVTVKKEERNVKRTVLKSIVGTLDLNIRHLLSGETFPGERVRAPLFCSIDKTDQNRYGYIANLCVAKSARRQGIASNMLHLSIRLAKANDILVAGVEQVFVHVHRNNRPAQELYRKIGFQVVDMATAQLSKEQTYLLCFE